VPQISAGFYLLGIVVGQMVSTGDDGAIAGDLGFVVDCGRLDVAGVRGYG
jgi:hypothetical protein